MGLLAITLLAMLLIAVLYASVGHGGASGYTAVLTLAGFGVDPTRSTALMLNVFVATIATVKFARQGHADGRMIAPLVLAGVPTAFAIAFIPISTRWISFLMGAVLLVASLRLLWKTTQQERPTHAARRGELWVTGMAMGALGSVTGTGGGIFLTPWLLARNLATPHAAAATTAPFILCISLAGLLGLSIRGQLQFVPQIWSLVPLVVLGGFLGAWCGSERFDPTAIRRMLAVVLLIAASKLLLRW
jgi:uncharacterized protein